MWLGAMAKRLSLYFMWAFLGRSSQVSYMVFFTSLHIFLMGFISSACCGQSPILTSACHDCHSWTTQKLWTEKWSCFTWIAPLVWSTLTDNTIMCSYWRLSKYSSIWWVFQPLHEHPTPTMNRTMATECGVWHIRTLVILSSLSLNEHEPIIWGAKCIFVTEYGCIPLVIHAALSKC